MDNFNLKKYLAEGKLKENFEFTEKDVDEMQKTAFIAGWNLSKNGGDAESAFKMWSSDLMEYLEEQYTGQFRSQSAQDLAIAKAKLSNAILALDPDNMETSKLAEETYLMLGNALKAHLDDLFNR